MISPPFDFNVRVKMFIIIMLIFSFLLAYLICLDMLLLLLLLFKFFLFFCLFVFGFFLDFCFTNMICKHLPFISHLLSMSDGAQKAKGSKQRRKTATFMISILKKKHQFCCSWYYILNYWFQSNFLSKSYQNQLQYCTFTLLVNVGLNFESQINAQTNKV